MSRVACVLFAALVGFASFPGAIKAQVSSSMTPETAFPVSLVSPDNALLTLTLVKAYMAYAYGWVMDEYELAEAISGRRGADEQPAILGVERDPRPVAEQRAAAALRRRVDREHRDRAAVLAPRPAQLAQQR